LRSSALRDETNDNSKRGVRQAATRQIQRDEHCTIRADDDVAHASEVSEQHFLTSDASPIDLQAAKGLARV
jgi:hypothetical protein